MHCFLFVHFAAEKPLEILFVDVEGGQATLLADGEEHNGSDPFMANVTEADTGYYLKVTAHEDGSFEVFNPRNKFSKNYPPASKTWLVCC